MDSPEETLKQAREELLDLQDDIDWSDVKNTWKSKAKKWQTKLMRIRSLSDLETLWELTVQLADEVKPTNFIAGWHTKLNDQPPRVMAWAEEVRNPQMALQRIRVLRGHLVRVVNGRKFATDGTPLAAEDDDTPLPSAAADQANESSSNSTVTSISVQKLQREKGLTFVQCRVNPDCMLESGHSGLCVLRSLQADRMRSASQPCAEGMNSSAAKASPSKAKQNHHPTDCSSSNAAASAASRAAPTAVSTATSASTSAAASSVSAPVTSRTTPAAAPASASNGSHAGPSGAPSSSAATSSCNCDGCRRMENCGQCEPCVKRSKGDKAKRKEDKCFLRVCHKNYSLYGNMLTRIEDFEGALVAYNKCLQETTSKYFSDGPSRAMVLRNRSLLFVRMKRYEDSLEDANAALRMQPDHWGNHWRRIEALFKLSERARNSDTALAVSELEWLLQAWESVESARQMVASMSTEERTKHEHDVTCRRLIDPENEHVKMYWTRLSELQQLERLAAATPTATPNAKPSAGPNSELDPPPGPTRDAPPDVPPNAPSSAPLDAEAEDEVTPDADENPAQDSDPAPTKPENATSTGGIQMPPAAPSPHCTTMGGATTALQEQAAQEESRRDLHHNHPSEQFTTEQVVLELGSSKGSHDPGAACTAASERLTEAQALEVLDAMQRLKSSKSSTNETVHGWVLCTSRRSGTRVVDMRAFDPADPPDCKVRIDSLVKLRRRLGISEEASTHRTAGANAHRTHDAVSEGTHTGEGHRTTLPASESTFVSDAAKHQQQPSASEVSPVGCSQQAGTNIKAQATGAEGTTDAIPAPTAQAARNSPTSFAAPAGAPDASSSVPAASCEGAGKGNVSQVWGTREAARKCLGKRVEVYWGGDEQWYSGTIVSIGSTCRARIRYDDSQRKWHSMWLEQYRFIDHGTTQTDFGEESSDDEEENQPLSLYGHGSGPARSTPPPTSMLAAGPSAERKEPDEMMSAALPTSRFEAKTHITNQQEPPSAASRKPNVPVATVADALESFENLVPHGCVSTNFKHNLGTWRKQVSACKKPGANPTEQIVKLRKLMLELNVGLHDCNMSESVFYFPEDFCKDGTKRKAWKRALHCASTTQELNALLGELVANWGERNASPSGADAVIQVRKRKAAAGHTNIAVEESDDALVTDASDDNDDAQMVERGHRTDAKHKRLVKGAIAIDDTQVPKLATRPPPWDTLKNAETTLKRLVKVFWGGDKRWYKGQITHINERTLEAHIVYTDGDRKWHSMWEEMFEFLDDGEKRQGKQSLARREREKQSATSARARAGKSKLGRRNSMSTVAKRVRRDDAADRPIQSQDGCVDLRSEATSSDSDSEENMVLTKRQRTVTHQKVTKVSKSSKSKSSLQPATQERTPSRVLGQETAPPYFLAPKPRECTCASLQDDNAANTAPCPDPCCGNYKYFDAMRHWADPHGRSGKCNNIKFELTDGMICHDALDATNDDVKLVALFGGARQHRKFDRKIEALAQWFLRADDAQAPPWGETDLAKTVLARKHPETCRKPPANLLYRIGGTTTTEWACDWSAIDSVIGKCRAEQVPTYKLLRLCAKVEPRDAWYLFFYDSAVKVNGLHTEMPMQLSGSKLPVDCSSESDTEDKDELEVVPADLKPQSLMLAQSHTTFPQAKGRAVVGSSGEEEFKSKRYRIKRKHQNEDKEGDVKMVGPPRGSHRPSSVKIAQPLTEALRAFGGPGNSAMSNECIVIDDDAADDVEERLCVECHQVGGKMIECDGECSRFFHFDCAGISTSADVKMLDKIRSEGNGKWECGECRMGKATCAECHQDGFVNAEDADGMIRCRRFGCGRALHRRCIPKSDEFSLRDGSWECPAHQCYHCNTPDLGLIGNLALLQCCCCPRAFCDKPECLPSISNMRRIGGCHIVCDVTRPHHRARESGKRLRVEALKEARAGVRFDSIVVPEQGDENAGLCRELGRAEALYDEASMGRTTATLLEERLSLSVQLGQMRGSQYRSTCSRDEVAEMDEAAENIKSGDVPWGVASVPKRLRIGSAQTRHIGSLASCDRSESTDRQTVVIKSDNKCERVYTGRFYPFTLTRVGHREHVPPTRMMLQDVMWPQLTPKLERIMKEASGEGSVVCKMASRGLAVDPSGTGSMRETAWVSSMTASSSTVSSFEVTRVVSAVRHTEGYNTAIVKELNRLKSNQRSHLNGLLFNRQKYTTYSRHFTSARVLHEIAKRVQPHLKAGDTFIDFACGQNSFGALLKDPGSDRPLATRAFDIISPGENTADFERRNWFSVAPHEMPQGELIIGLNPPFGHMNREAIRFVNHALCMKPRLIVLIMPTTNYVPEGYDLILHDDQLCRGSVFYTPGSKAHSRTDAKNVSPLFLMYRRNPYILHKEVECTHFLDFRRKTTICARQRQQRADTARKKSQELQQLLPNLASSMKWQV